MQDKAATILSSEPCFQLRLFFGHCKKEQYALQQYSQQRYYKGL